MVITKTAEELNAEIERLNARIAEEEASIEALYPKIGKAYCAACADAPADAVKELVGAFRRASAQIDACKKEIKTCSKALGLLRGFVSCDKCGKEVSIHAAFCGACGASMSGVLADLASEDDVICPACGLASPSGSIYCEKCGAKIGAQTAAVPVAADLQTESAPIEIEKALRCPECGTKVEEGDLFCPECGHKMA